MPALPPWQPPLPPQDPFSPEPDPLPYSRSGPPSSPSFYPTTPIPYPPPAMPYAGYGVDPLAGQPLSDKSKLAAGLLQLIPGFCLSVGGIGRLYAGHTALGAVQLVCSVVAWAMAICGFALFVPWIAAFGIWLWFVIDGIMLLAGRPTDGQGRLLRP